MYALNLICLFCLLLSGDVTLQMTVEPSIEDNVTQPSSSIASADSTLPPAAADSSLATATTADGSSSTTPGAAASPTEEQRNCSTARSLEGACVPRQFCEFSTHAIDLTLYMPRGFTHPCKLGETCCPFRHLLTVTKPALEFDDSGFGFDDDD